MSQEQNPKTKTGTKRKQTVPVAERLMFFNKQHPNGCIRTEQVGMPGRAFCKMTFTRITQGLRNSGGQNITA